MILHVTLQNSFADALLQIVGFQLGLAVSRVTREAIQEIQASAVVTRIYSRGLARTARR